MKTNKQLLDLVKSYKGKKIDWDGYYGLQCMDLAVRYLFDAIGHVTWGNAKDAILNNFGGKATIYENTKDFLPKVGDVAVWTKAPADSRYGHIALVYSNPTMSSMTVLEQNWDGQANTGAKTRVDDYRGVTHFIRPHTVAEASTKKKTVADIAKEVLAGAWGNGADRKARLEKSGYNYAEVQSAVSALVTAKPKATTTKVQTSGSSAPTTKWKKNKYGTWYYPFRKRFRVGNQAILTRLGSPKMSAAAGGWFPKNTDVVLDELCLSEGLQWGGYWANDKNGKATIRVYIPIGVWDTKVLPPKFNFYKGVGVKEYWGKLV